MNIISGQITEVTSEGELSLVRVASGESQFSTIVIDTPETLGYLRKGEKIKLLFKETEVVLAKQTTLDISLQNQIAGKVDALEIGKLLSRVEIECVHGRITSVVTSQAIHQLKLKKGDSCCCMIKTNEIMLSQ